MAFLPGLKKQFNKANQFMTERITGVEGTKLDNEFQEMERRTDLFNEMTDDLQLKTKEFLQPNPTIRAKMTAVKGISKLSGQAKASTYPQPEGTLGDAMCGYGRKLQDFDNGNVYASALIEMGESMKVMADFKYALDDNVKQNYLEPMHHTQSKDLKEVMHHRKKLTELLSNLLILFAQVLVLLKQGLAKLGGEDEVPLLGKQLGVDVRIRVTTSSSSSSCTSSCLKGVDVVV